MSIVEESAHNQGIEHLDFGTRGHARLAEERSAQWAPSFAGRCNAVTDGM